MCGAVFLAATRLTHSKAGVPTITQTLCSCHNWSLIVGQIQNLVAKMGQSLRPGRRTQAEETETQQNPPVTVSKRLQGLTTVLVNWSLSKMPPSVVQRTVLEIWMWLIAVVTSKRRQHPRTGATFNI